MTNISGVNKNFPASHAAYDKKTGRANEADRKASLQGSATQMNKLIVELNLNIKIESKDRFGTQASINQLIEPSGIDLSQLIYNGKPITELSQDEAKTLISEDGYFGVKNTAQRIYDFVAGNAERTLKNCRSQGMLFSKALKMRRQCSAVNCRTSVIRHSIS